jgi:dihydrodipicolinate synthase/N-acetylneuraminate lyase
MKKPVFTGAGVAIITPMYDDGSVNFDELGRIVDDQIQKGTDAIIICGTTGECATLTDEEHLACHRGSPCRRRRTAFRSSPGRVRTTRITAAA